MVIQYSHCKTSTHILTSHFKTLLQKKSYINIHKALCPRQLFQLVFLEPYHVKESTGWPVTVVHPLGILSKAWHSHHIVAKRSQLQSQNMWIHVVSPAWSTNRSMRSHTSSCFRNSCQSTFFTLTPISVPYVPEQAHSYYLLLLWVQFHPVSCSFSRHTCLALVSYLTEIFKATGYPL